MDPRQNTHLRPLANAVRSGWITNRIRADWSGVMVSVVDILASPIIHRCFHIIPFRALTTYQCVRVHGRTGAQVTHRPAARHAIAQGMPLSRPALRAIRPRHWASITCTSGEIECHRVPPLSPWWSINSVGQPNTLVRFAGSTRTLESLGDLQMLDLKMAIPAHCGPMKE